MRVILVVMVIVVTGYQAVAQVYKVRLIAESQESQDVVNAVKAKLRATNRYAVTDEPRVDFTLEVECAVQTPSHGYICAFTPIFWGQTVFPLPAPMGGISLVKGPSVASVADAVSLNFASQTTEENISLIVRSMHDWVVLFCKNAANKTYCMP
jgi:hypothetical protein